MERDEQIARAFIAISVVNHYMVGFINIASEDELQRARNILINWSNNKNNKDEVLERAINLIEKEIKGVIL